MSRATSVPSVHNHHVADFIRRTLFAHQWSPIGFGSGSGTVSYHGSGTKHFLQVVRSVYETRRPDAVGQFITTPWDVPDDLHIGSRLRARVLWAASDTAGSQTATWILTYSTIAEGTALADATTAVDTAIGTDTDSTTAYGLNKSGWAIINAASLTNNQTLNLRIELDAVSGLSAANDQIHFLGLEIEYTRRFI